MVVLGRMFCSSFGVLSCGHPLAAPTAAVSRPTVFSFAVANRCSSSSPNMGSNESVDF